MTNDPYEVISQYANHYPVDIGSIGRALGLAIIVDEGLPDNVSGYLKRDSGGYFIGVNPRHAYVRQRFTVAHEIAHYILHRNLIGDGVVDDTLYRSNLSGGVEAEANRLAAQILMPFPLIEKVRRDFPGIRPEELAQQLGVSDQALSIRLGVPYG